MEKEFAVKHSSSYIGKYLVVRFCCARCLCLSSSVVFIDSSLRYFFISISQNKLTALLKHYKEHGLTPRVKKSGGRQERDQRLLTHDDICRVVSFIVNFAELHALVLPGRIPGYKRFDVKLLPSHYTKATVFRAYESAIKAKGRYYEYFLLLTLCK